MILSKNNRLSQQNPRQLTQISNKKKKANEKIRISTFKSGDTIKSYHPLKQKKIKLHRLNFISNKYYNPGFAGEDQKCGVDFVINAHKKKYMSASSNAESDKYLWSTEADVVEWLLSVGVQIKKISSQKYILKDRICFISSVLVHANKKRRETGLEPFYLSEYTEF